MLDYLKNSLYFLSDTYSFLNHYNLIDILCFFLVVLYIRAVAEQLDLHEKEHRRESENHFDMVKITGRDIENYYCSEKYPVPNEFPAPMNRFLKMFTSLEISKFMMELNSTNMSLETASMIKRGLTLSAAMNHSVIPKQLVLIDAQTKALWIRIKFDFEPKNVSAKFDLGDQEISSKRSNLGSITACASRYYVVTGLILRHAYLDTFPSLENFTKYINYSRTTPKPYQLEQEEVKLIATAFAFQTGIMIPAIYISQSSLVPLLIRQMTIKPPKLKLIQDEPVADAESQ